MLLLIPVSFKNKEQDLDLNTSNVTVNLIFINKCDIIEENLNTSNVTVNLTAIKTIK